MFLVFLIGIYFCFLYLPNLKVREVIGNQFISSTPPNNIEINDATLLQSLLNQLITSNFGYLGICVTIILFAGGFFYLFNLKPLQTSIEKQEEKIESIKKEVRIEVEGMSSGFRDLVLEQTRELRISIGNTASRIDSLTKDTEARTNNAEKKINEFVNKANQELKVLKNQYQDSEVQRLWNATYTWESLNVPMNVLDTMVECMEKAIEYKRTYLNEIWLDKLEGVLEGLGVKLMDDTDKKILTEVLLVLGKVEGSSEQKARITKQINSILASTKIN